MRSLLWILGILMLVTAPAVAQDTPKIEIFGGYSYLRVNTGGTGINLNGWNASVQGNVNNWFSVVGDFSGHYGSVELAPGVSLDVNNHAFLFGPRISCRKHERFTPFAHVLLGGARNKFSAQGLSSSDTAFAAALGSGVDVKVSDRIALRLFQADYVLTRFGSDTQNNFRLSTGLVLRLGQK